MPRYESDSDSDDLMRSIGAGRRRRGGAVAGAGRGQRDPMVHLAKTAMVQRRAVEGGMSPAMLHRANQKATHAHMMGRGVSGGAMTGGGFLSDLGIPIISNIAGAIGLGHPRRGRGVAGAGGADSEYYYHSPPFVGAGVTGGRRRGGAMTGGAMTGGMVTGGAMTGGGFLSDLGIPIVSQLAGAIGLGKGRRRRGGAMTGGALLGQDGHGVYHGGAMTGGAVAGAGTRKGQVRRTARRAYEGGAMTGGGVAGAGFWDDFKQGFNSVVAPVASIAKPLLSLAGPEGRVASMGLSALGYGKQRRAKAGPNDGRRKRAEIVRRVMAERGVSMIEASKIVKAEGLY